MKKHRKFLLTLIAGLALCSSFAFAGPKAAIAKSRKKTVTTVQVKHNNNWLYPFSHDNRYGVHPLYFAQTFGNTDYLRCLHPRSYFHDGWDFGVSEVGKKAKVEAIHPGKVKQVRYGNGLGWFVWVISKDKYVEIYQEGFNSKKDIKVKPGQNIKTGQKIGYLTGTHLHLGLSKTNRHYINANGYPCGNWYKNNGTWLNPVKTIAAHHR